MLVLSRRSTERILFPSLDISVQVLQILGNTVRLGIEAPSEVTILREEVMGKSETKPVACTATRESAHALCNRLSKVTLSLYVFEQQWRAGLEEDARATLTGILNELSSMDRDWIMSHFAAGKPSAAASQRCRTLVVEDDSNQRELLAGMLKMNGCDCDTAADGTDALDYLASHDRPDLMLLDMWMPRCDGPHTVQQVRSNPHYAGMKVFAISSTSPQELGLRTGPDGVDAWFAKPLNPGKLWDAIQASLAAPN
jgi:carbon storage regulator CsrA